MKLSLIFSESFHHKETDFLSGTLREQQTALGNQIFNFEKCLQSVNV
jgi:hypothetical protein